MARPGITKQEVFAAANELLSQGTAPTIEQIRQILKSGSNSTIAGHLRDWKASQSDSASLALTSGLPQDLVSVMKELWGRVSAQTNVSVEEAESKAAETIHALEATLEKYKSNNRRWQQLFTQWQQDKEKLVAENETLKHEIARLTEENHDLDVKVESQAQQLQEKRLRVEELHRLHSQSQTNLEHYRESSREQRLIDQALFDKQKQELQHELKLLREQQILLRETNSKQEHTNQILHEKYNNLENTHQALHQTVQHQAQQISSLEKEKSEHYQSSTHWQSQYKEIQLNLNETSIKLIHSEQTLKDLQDQTKLLSQEKWTTLQEKAQLEGQLKQLQKMINA